SAGTTFFSRSDRRSLLKGLPELSTNDCVAAKAKVGSGSSTVAKAGTYHITEPSGQPCRRWPLKVSISGNSGGGGEGGAATGDAGWIRVGTITLRATTGEMRAMAEDWTGGANATGPDTAETMATMEVLQP